MNTNIFYILKYENIIFSIFKIKVKIQYFFFRMAISHVILEISNRKRSTGSGSNIK
jgi:hypothetical protein